MFGGAVPPYTPRPPLAMSAIQPMGYDGITKRILFFVPSLPIAFNLHIVASPRSKYPRSLVSTYQYLFLLILCKHQLTTYCCSLYRTSCLHLGRSTHVRTRILSCCCLEYDTTSLCVPYTGDLFWPMFNVCVSAIPASQQHQTTYKLQKVSKVTGKYVLTSMISCP